MRLIGMLDSPYVRRAAIALRLLDIPFEHDPLSVFRTFDQFSRINPVVKAPTLVCDDGTVLMDSGLIIDYAQALAGRGLWPAALAARTRALRTTGLAMAACEKIVQIVYEHVDQARYAGRRRRLSGPGGALGARRGLPGLRGDAGRRVGQRVDAGLPRALSGRRGRAARPREPRRGARAIFGPVRGFGVVEACPGCRRGRLRSP